MDIEIDNGRRVSLLPHEMTPLDVAIAQFEMKAKAYHSLKRQTRAETPEKRLKREKELASALETEIVTIYRVPRVTHFLMSRFEGTTGFLIA